jgi:hypothetical protein
LQTQERSYESIEEDFANIFEVKGEFRHVLQENTVDHQMLLIDQTEAKYTAEEIFKVDKAPDPSKEELTYRIGCDAFWKEAQCNWDKQLIQCGFAKEIQGRKRDGPDGWEKIVEQQWEQEKRNKTGDNNYEELEQDDKPFTSITGLATAEQQESMRQAYLKKNVPTQSRSAQAMELVRGGYWKFTQPPDTFY